MSDQFPYLDAAERIRFPEPDDDSGIVGAGGNLSPGMLLSAYEQGAFPWYGPDEPILWWSPPERAVLFPGELHVSRSMHRIIRKSQFQATFNQAFNQVIASCRSVPRPGQSGTWITPEMEAAYRKLHQLGWAHSLEVWTDDLPGARRSPDDRSRNGAVLAGGLYGIRIGKAFFGESMFSLVSNASKFALICLHRLIMQEAGVMIDCQIMNSHLATLGVRKIGRDRYLQLLDEALSGSDIEIPSSEHRLAFIDSKANLR